MTNREWLLNEMQNMSDEEFVRNLEDFCRDNVNVCKIMREECEDTGDCTECIIKWLKAEHKEKITISEAERIILGNINKDYKWICRDKDNTLKLYIYKPKNHKGNWFADEVTISYRLECFNHLFQFITWNDSEPYNIEELLKGE